MAKKSLREIDPALDMLGEFAKLTQNTSHHVQKMREENIFTDGHFSAKTKALAAALWGVAARCEPCLVYYVLQAKERGATKEEVCELLAVAVTMGGCVGEMWALKAYRAFKENDSSDEFCCDEHL